MTTKRLLIVSPHFPPVNAADMQRVRMLLPFFLENGWQAEVLAVAPEQVAAPLDSWLVVELMQDVKVHRVKALGLGWSRIPGLGTLGLRALWALANAGDRLLEKSGFDLVYFSTTVFEVHLLGPRWKHKYGVPFVMDYQDPWANDYYREHPDIVPPGGRLKYALAGALHRWMEPRVLRECAGITSVSPAYPKQLAQRYSWLGKLPSLVQPFPGARRDFERLAGSQVSQKHFDPRDGLIHWVYIGVVIPGMFPVLRALFRAITTAMPTETRELLRLHFIGTSYAPGGRAVPRVQPLAAEYGLADQVQEQCERIPYAQALKCLSDADALIAVGSDDPGYTASKIYPYLLARKPLLAIYHENSSVVEMIRQVGGAVCIPFAAPVDEDALVQAIDKSWLEGEGFTILRSLNDSAFEPYTDHGSAAVLCRFLEERLSHV
jgi:hypothetical protein